MYNAIKFGISITLIIFFCNSAIVKAATPTIITGAEPLSRNSNLVINGSFEEPHLDNGNDFGGLLPGVDGDGYYYISTGTILTPFALPDGWTTSGGGPDTYARWGNNFNALPAFNVPVAGQAWSSTQIHGERSIYLGNQTPREISETPQFMPNGEVVFSSPPTILPGVGFGTGVTITQTVTGLIPSGVYRISFWVSGEWGNEDFATSSNGLTAGDGIMGVVLEGYDTLYLAVPAGNSAEPPGAPHVFGTDDFHIYTLEFVATGPEMEVSFINWGHFDSTTTGWTRGLATELIMDDVIINAVNLPINIPTLSEWSVIAMAVLLGIVGVLIMRRRVVAV